MAEQNVSLSFADLKRLKHKLDNITLSGGQSAKLLRSIGTELEAQTKERITSDKESPEGESWKSWAKSYAKWRTKIGQNPGDGIGILSGDMRDNVSYNLVNQYVVKWGSSQEYASYFNDQRPFLGVSDRDEEELEELVDEFLARLAK